MTGDARIDIGSLITLTGFRDEVEGTSSVTTVRHRIDGRGYRLELKAELPTERAREDKGRERGGRAR
jgi:hypothetical protein